MADPRPTERAATFFDLALLDATEAQRTGDTNNVADCLADLAGKSALTGLTWP
jgi:hypothetical protein